MHRLAALRIRQRLRVAVESAQDRTLAVVPLAHKHAPALLPHNTTCLRLPHNAMHSPSFNMLQQIVFIYAVCICMHDFIYGHLRKVSYYFVFFGVLSSLLWDMQFLLPPYLADIFEYHNDPWATWLDSTKFDMQSFC